MKRSGWDSDECRVATRWWSPISRFRSSLLGPRPWPVWVGGILALCLTASALTSEPAGNPYQSIVDRNAFGLKPPPPPPDPEANKPPPPKLTLTGITTLLGNKRALMKAPPAPLKPGEQSKGELSYILKEGERDGDVEVLEINEIAGSVKVNNAGTVMTLTFEKDGAKIASSPASAPGGPPGMSAPPPPNPGGGFGLPSAGGGGPKTIPTRTLRMPSAPSSSAATSSTGSGGYSGYGGGTPAYGSSPNVSLGGQMTSGLGSPAQNLNTQPDPNVAQSLPQRTPEETVALYEANRLKNQALNDAGVARFPRLPQHPYLRGSSLAQPAPGQGDQAPQ